MSFTEFVGVCVSLCMLGRRATLWERWRRFVVSWPTISAPTRSGGDRACSSGNLRPGECLSVFVCETVVQYVPLLLLTSQCVTHVSSSAARLDAMETYFLFATPSSLLYRHIRLVAINNTVLYRSQIIHWPKMHTRYTPVSCLCWIPFQRPMCRTTDRCLNTENHQRILLDLLRLNHHVHILQLT